MKKSDKKIEKALRESLTNVCDMALDKVPEFVWLTHTVNFNAYPSSLKIVCVFETDLALSQALENKQDALFYRSIADEFKAANLSINALPQCVFFDTEETCQRTHNGKWHERLSKMA